MKINYKEDLNEEQYEVVTKADGYALVLAGAGSGKTRTITYRVAYLLEEGLAKADEILLMTFTNKAAREMLERVNSLVGGEYKIPGGTFHRMGNLFLRQNIYLLGYTQSFSILDQDDSQQLINFCISDLGYNIKKNGLPQIGVIQHLISYTQNTQRTFEDVLADHEFTSDVEERLKRINIRYKEEKKRLNHVDFDDLLALWLEILKKYPNTLQDTAGKFKYLLVDEYQDVNAIQAELVSKLAEINKNVLVVGDDAQSIYSFRAADVTNILSFPKFYPGAKIFKLEKNYRSAPDILALAQESISFNEVQYEKALEPVVDKIFVPLLVSVRDSKGQGQYIAQKIKDFQYDGQDLRGIAILARSMYQTIDIQLALSNHNIPYIVRGGQRYFEQAHIKDILTFLKVLHNFKDEVAWRRLLLMFDGIGAKYAQTIVEKIAAQDNFDIALTVDLGLRSSRAKSGWNRARGIFNDVLNFWMKDEKIEVVKILEYIYKTFYIEYLRDNYDKFEERSAALEQFMDFSLRYENISDLLTDITLDEEHFKKNRGKEQDDEAIVLSTIHQSKGLEWDIVFIANLYQGGFPHYKSIENQKELQEERRLFYVAVTRAKNELYLMFPNYSMHYAYGEVKNQVSVFLDEVDSDLYDETTYMA